MESVLRRPNRQVRRCRQGRRRELRVFSYSLPPPNPLPRTHFSEGRGCAGAGGGSYFSKNRVFSGGSAPSPPRACLALVHRFILCFLEARLASPFGGGGPAEPGRKGFLSEGIPPPSRLPARVLRPGGARPEPTGAEAETGIGKAPQALNASPRTPRFRRKAGAFLQSGRFRWLRCYPPPYPLPLL